MVLATSLISVSLMFLDFLQAVDKVTFITLYLIRFVYTIGFAKGVQNKLINVDENIYIPVTKAEFAVLTSGFNVRFFATTVFVLLCL